MKGYDDFRSLLDYKENRWARTGKCAKDNLDNINNIANYFEKPFKQLLGTKLRKIGSGRDYITGSQNEDGTYWSNQQNIQGHIAFEGQSAQMAYLCSCLKLDGFNIFVEYPTHLLRNFDGQLVLFFHNDVCLAVNMKQAFSGVSKPGRETKRHNTQINVMELFDRGYVYDYFKWDPKANKAHHNGKDVAITADECKAYQEFKLRPHHRGDGVTLIKLQRDVTDTTFSQVRTNKKALWKELTDKGLCKVGYRAFCIGINSTTENMLHGKISQRPIIYSGPLGDFIVVSNEEYDPKISERYKLDVEKYYYAERSEASLEGTRFPIKKYNNDLSLNRSNLNKNLGKRRFYAPRGRAARKGTWSNSNGTTPEMNSKSIGKETSLTSSSKPPITAVSPLIRRTNGGAASPPSSRVT